MKDCPICKSNVPGPNEECSCGYNWEKEEVTNLEKIRISFSQLPIRTKWKEKCAFVNSLHKIQQKKKRGRWSYDKTADMLSVSRSTVSDMINLADGISDYPELSRCTSYDEAKKLLKNKIRSGIISLEKFVSETELQEYMETHWDKTPFAEDWEIAEKQFRAGVAGKIDLLARHKDKTKWLIIELKKDKSSDDAVGQTLRYMGWVKENHARPDEEIEGVIISGFPPDENMRYALLFAPAVQQRMYCLDKEQSGVHFFDKEESDMLLEFTKMSIPEQLKLLEKVRKQV